MVEIQVKGILFDMDGTLVNTVACVEKWWCKMAKEHGVDAAELVKSVHGRPTYNVLCDWFPSSTHSVSYAEKFEAQVMADADGVFAVPGADRVLRMLDQTKWAVVTAATKALAQTRLQQARLPMPKILVAAGDVAQGKPHPECYELGANMLGIASNEALVFEDSVNGVLAGKAVGATVIGVLTSATEQQLRDAGAHYVVPDFGRVSVDCKDDCILVSLIPAS
ncbi:hypothetical protein GGI20_003856 [Coemansia sp. BCRC 34301]|nr:hypothetical protein GGI20_003856 [Coemansia sp. BCRC 34301]